MKTIVFFTAFVMIWAIIGSDLIMPEPLERIFKTLAILVIAGGAGIYIAEGE